MFGGTGTQAAVVWRDGEVCLGPATTVFGPDAPERTSSQQWWAFNRALRKLGASRDDASDEFDALCLGKWRHTEDWPTTAS
jgi:hypothetical protein